MVRLRDYVTGNFYDIEAGANTKRMAGRIARAKLRDRIGKEAIQKYETTRVTFVRNK